MKNILQSRSFKWSVTMSIIAIIAWVITWRFYAMWWFILAFADLAIFLLFLLVFLGSVVFWIKNIKKYTCPFVPLSIHIATITIIILTPSIERNRSYYKNTTDLSSQKSKCSCHLYIETYCVYGGGAWGGDVDSYYLTDSVNFKIYLGVADEENDRFFVKCTGDHIDVEKIVNANLAEWRQPKITEQKTYNLKDLRKQ